MLVLMSLIRDLRSLPRLVWVLFAGTLVNRFGSFVFVFLTFYLTGQGYSAAQAGFAVGMYGVGAIGASLAGGWLADHLGRRNSIVLSMVLSAATMLVFSQATGYALLVGLSMLAGFCAEMYRPAASALIADVTTPAQRVTAYAVYRLAINLGFAIGPAVGGFMAHRSFFYLFAGDALTSLVYAGIAVAMLPNRIVEHHADPERRNAFRIIMRDTRFLFFLGATWMGSMVFMQHVSGYPLQIKAYGYSSGTFGLLLSLNGAIICLTELPLTTLTRRLPTRRVMATGFLVFGTGFVMTGYVSAIPLLAASAVLWTLGEMLYFPMSAAHVANVSPPHMRGRYQGAWGIAWGAGAVIGPMLGTRLFQWHARSLWLACGACSLLGCYLLL
ncbi:MAG TPA: MFS transporter, partial [Candidatus Krumholzibacteria bacterium]|nr:MFS transporter [Candidatus Krumholzibacteria bacterium]